MSKFDELVKIDIPKLMENFKYSSEHVDISFKYNGYVEKLNKEIDGTLCTTVSAEVNVINKTTQEKLVTSLDLLRVPVLTSLGYKVGKSYKQVLDVYSKANGWYIIKHKEDNTSKPGTSDVKVKMSFLPTTGIQLEFECRRHCIYVGSKNRQKVPLGVFLKVLTGKSYKELINILGINKYILSSLQKEHNVSKSIKELTGIILRRTMSDKARDAVAMKETLFSPNFLTLNAASRERFADASSFATRAVNKTLAEDTLITDLKILPGTILTKEYLKDMNVLPVAKKARLEEGELLDISLVPNIDSELFKDYDNIFNKALAGTPVKFTKDLLVDNSNEVVVTNKVILLGTLLTEDVLNNIVDSSVFIDERVIPAGTILTRDVLLEIDNSSVNTLNVVFDNTVFELKKYPFMNDRLTVEELFTAVNMYACALDGFDTVDDQYELTSRVLETYNNLVINRLKNHMISSVNVIETSAKKRSLQLIEKKIPYDINGLISYLKKEHGGESQQADITNPVAFIAKSMKITNLYNAKAPEDMIKIQDYQRGRLDPVDAPESSKIGKVHFLTIHAKKSDCGFIVAPYMKVVNGVVVGDKPVYLSAGEERHSYIAEWNEKFESNSVKAYYGGTIVEVPKNKVSYIEYSPTQSSSFARSIIPFPENSNPKRALMGGNHLKQAITLIKPERPLVSTGCDCLKEFIGDWYRTAEDILRESYEEDDIDLKNEISEEDFIKSSLVLKATEVKHEYRDLIFIATYKTANGYKNRTIVNTIPFLQKTDKESIFTTQIVATKNNIFKGKDIVYHNTSIDAKKYALNKNIDFGHMPIQEDSFDRCLALGRNFLVGVKSTRMGNVDDAIVIRRGLICDGALTSVSMKEKKAKIRKSDRYTEYFGFFGNSKPSYMLDNGLPRIGTFLKPGSLIIGKYRTKSTIANKTTTTSQNPHNVYLDNHTSGEVVFATIEDDEAIVILASINSIDVGDKLSGRHGNKGVIARVEDDENMPFIKETGEILDITLNPLGIPSRMNISQCVEICLGMIMRQQGKVAIISPYKENSVEYVNKLAKEANVGYTTLIDGSTGLEFKRPVSVGMLYMLKLEHQAKKKLHSINEATNVDVVTLQPKKGQKAEGGQAFGEYETWVLGNTGCTKVMQDLFSIQSDDIRTKKLLSRQIESNPNDISCDGENRNDYVAQMVIRALGIEVGNDSNSNGDYTFSPLTDKTIKSLYPEPLDINNPDSLHDEIIFGNTDSTKRSAESRSRWGWIDLGCEIIHPYWLYKGSVAKYLIVNKRLKVSDDSQPNKQIKEIEKEEACSFNDLKTLLDAKAYVTASFGDNIFYSNFKISEKSITGVDAVVYLFKHCTIDKAVKYYQKLCTKQLEKTEDKYDSSYSRLYAGAKDWKTKGIKLSDLIITSYPVIPQIFRPKMPIENREHDYDQYYKKLFSAVKDNKKESNNKSKRKIIEFIDNFLGISTQPKNKNKLVPLLTRYAGKNQNAKGFFRTSVLSKRVDYSGRAVITPTQNPNMKITEIGVPLVMGVTIYQPHLVSLLKRTFPAEYYLKSVNKDSKEVNSAYIQILTSIASDNLRLFRDIVKTTVTSDDGIVKTDKQLFFDIRKLIISFIEDRVVLAGRQPSLHKFSLRAYSPIITFHNTIEVHPLVCKGYNADFDGDAMYLVGLLTREACEEAKAKLSPIDGVINPKDSSPIIELSQDTCLGIYFATSLYDNALSIEGNPKYESIYNFQDVEGLMDFVETDMIELQDLACVKVNGKLYLSTVGRILFNSKLPNGFTDKPFTNPLHIPNVNVERYNSLAYDGLIAKKTRVLKDTKTDEEGNVISEKTFQYYSLSDITTDCYLNSPKMTAMKMFQDLMVFGFDCCHISGITLGLQDMKINPEVKHYCEEAKKIGETINKAYAEGLISAESRKSTLIKVYDELTEFLKKLVLTYLPRNNNLFIIKDSGARGNDNQIMQTIGIVGVSMKTLTESLEVPILSSYAGGLTSMEMMLASYGGRMGVSSTQNETSTAGYATRQAIFMLNGFDIVEHDCGQTDTSLELHYTEPCKLLDSFGNVLVHDNIKEIESKLLDKRILTFEGKLAKILKNFLPQSKVLNSNCIKLIFKHHIKELHLEDGLYKLKYRLDDLDKDLLLRREAMLFENEKPLPYLIDSKYISEKTVKYIEEENFKTVNVRTIMNCKSIGGCCQRCFGLKFDKNELPEIGEAVGIESAQSLGEPASQLTMSLFHQGGIAGTSVSSGVAVFKSLLGGNLPEKDIKAVLAPKDDYVSIQEFGDNAIITIGNEIYETKSALVQVLDGEYVELGEPLSNGFVVPDMIGKRVLGNKTLKSELEELEDVADLNNLPSGNVSLPIEIIKKRQRSLLETYFNTFKQKIKVHARHFEILVRVQTNLVRIKSADEDLTGLVVGKNYELIEVLQKMEEFPQSFINYDFNVSKQGDVVRHFSGPMAAIGFEDICNQLNYLTTFQDISSKVGFVGKIFVGEDLTKNKRKVLLKPELNLDIVKRIKTNVKHQDEIIYNFDEIEENLQDDDLFKDIDFGEFDLGDSAKPTSDETDTHTTMNESSVETTQQNVTTKQMEHF